MKTQTTHTISGHEVTVTTTQTNQFPPAFKLVAKHPDGSTHETTITMGDAELKNITTLEDAQKHLDTARQKCAETASKKAALAKIAASLQ